MDKLNVLSPFGRTFELKVLCTDARKENEVDEEEKEDGKGKGKKNESGRTLS